MKDASLTLTRSAAAWNRPTFRSTLIDEMQTLGPDHPALHPLLQAGLRQTSAVADDALAVHLLSSREQEGRILVQLGIFYAGIIAGCSCADDPSPIDTITEHCELLLDIDLATGRARATLCDG
ncbi:MAG: hypothetical protein WBM40_17190 [Thiohalocapsa sp.]